VYDVVPGFTLITVQELLRCHLSVAVWNSPIIPFEILLPRLISMGLRVGWWVPTGCGRHYGVAGGNVEEQNGIVDSDREDDSERILIFTQDIGVDQD
jgi:hypothetical protein